MERNTITLNLTTDELSYLAELLNNERYAANTNATIAESLLCHLVAHEAHAIAALTDEDAYWSAREAALNDEHIDAECAARSLGY